MKIRVLFFADASSLAHVVRSAFLAQNLNTDKFEIHFATDSKFHHFIESKDITTHQLSCLPKKEFAQRLKHGSSVFDFQRTYDLVEEEKLIIEEIKPSLVIGDFRPTLAISTQILKLPYINIINFYWSNFYETNCPESPVTRFLGFNLSNWIFKWLKYAVYPFFLYSQVRGVNKLSRKLGLKTYWSIFDFYLAANINVFPDLAELAKPNCSYAGKFIGPITWFPNSSKGSSKTLFSWKNDYKKIFLSLGSTGNYDLLPKILNCLSLLKVEVVVSMAGEKMEPYLPPNSSEAKFTFMEYVPGEQANQECDLAITNGGSPSAYQSLKYGKPFLGVITNMDQVLAMEFFEKAGVALALRDWCFSEELFMEKLTAILCQGSFSQRSNEASLHFQKYDTTSQFQIIVEELIEKMPKI